MTVRIHGHSDDLVCLDVDGQATEVGADDEVRFRLGHEEAAPGQNAAGVLVTMRYTENGCWSAEIGQINEDCEIPWPVRVEARMGERNLYSVTAIVECPLGTPCVVMRRRNLAGYKTPWRRYDAETGRDAEAP